MKESIGYTMIKLDQMVLKRVEWVHLIKLGQMVLKGVIGYTMQKSGHMVLKGVNRVHNEKI